MCRQFLINGVRGQVCSARPCDGAKFVHGYFFYKGKNSTIPDHSACSLHASIRSSSLMTCPVGILSLIMKTPGIG